MTQEDNRLRLSAGDHLRRANDCLADIEDPTLADQMAIVLVWFALALAGK